MQVLTALNVLLKDGSLRGVGEGETLWKRKENPRWFNGKEGKAERERESRRSETRSVAGMTGRER